MSSVIRRSSMALFSNARDHYSHRVRLVLAEKGVTVDVVEADDDNKPEDLAEVNPYNSLPTLLDRDLALYEVNVIIEYLDERFPHPPLLPVYPVQRAQSRLWIYRIDREWSSKLDILVAGRQSEAERNRVKEELRESIISTARIFSRKPFFMNDELTLVDCCVVPILWRLKMLDINLRDKSARPLRNYMQRMFERTAFRRSLTEAEQEMQE